MAGQKTPIVSTDYNGLQNKINDVLGVGTGNYGYGQEVTSTQIPNKSLITISQWNNLRDDVLKARQHQTGLDESSSLPEITVGTEVSDSIYNTFNQVLTVVETNRLITPPSSQATRENLVVGTRTTAWNSMLTHTATIDFDTPDQARWYFNSGGAIEISANRTGGTVNIKNNTWSTLLTNMGTVRFTKSSTTATGSGTGSAIGFDDLTITDQLVFQKLTGNQSYYSLNEYNVRVRIGASESEIVFTIEFNDIYDQVGDENVDGTLTSTIQVFRSSGSNVSNRRPSATSSFTGGSVVITPAEPVPDITYSLTSNTNIIGEGSTGVTFNVSTTNVSNGTLLYWTTNSISNIVSQDFADNQLSGTITINSDSASFVRLATSDSLTEGLESFFIELRTGSTSGPVVATSDIIQVQDLSISPTPYPATFNVDQTSSIITEGSLAVTFTMSTTNVANGTVIYWTTNGSGVTSSDFVDNVTSGSFTINNSLGTVSRVAKLDYVTEGAEFFNLEFRTDSLIGPIVAVSNGVGINDASQTPAFALTVLPTIFDEGAIITLTLLADNILSGSEFFLTHSGALADNDVTQLSGPEIDINTKSFIYQSSPTVWTFRVLADLTTEGTETASWKVRSGSSVGQVLATSELVTVNDTSMTPSPTYSIISSTNLVNEGAVVTFTVISSGADGVYYWNQIGTASADDFTDGLMTGAFTLSGGVGTIHRIVKADKLTESIESIVLRIRQGNVIVATSNPVTISDSSTSPLYSIVSSASSVSENLTIFTFTFTTSDPDGIYYWSNIGTASAEDFSDGLNSGSFVVSNGSGVIQRAATADLLTDSNETVILEVRQEPNGEALTVSNAVTILDTSGTPVGSQTFAPGKHVFTVPANVYLLTFNAFGAGGGNGGLDASSSPGPGSSGYKVSGSISVSPGTDITFYVGAAGRNGSSGSAAVGGAGGSSYGAGFDGGRGGSSGWHGTSGSGGGGGAATAIVYNNIVRVVAGGGGGGGGSGQYGSGSPGIYDPPGGLPYSGAGSVGRNCGWADGGGGGGGGGGRGAGAGATADSPAYDTGGRGGQAGGSWVDGSVISNVSYGIGSARGGAGSLSVSWGT